ncbi:hypothetical protein [Marinicella litoralis]|uniref:Putative outer membrane repeat protein n=1 Tax=Marinicella litoralis TaxID=644220 RepID=A0A4R6XM59_9GAMM|nr:hypothetical protein [Marinicella litoralis]TDR20735.1 putative outer membrane repeat protein [Marinicella litoralis]
MRNLIVFICLLLGLSEVSYAGNNYVVVGPASDPDCDFSTIQAAINGIAQTQGSILVSSENGAASYNENIVIDGKALVIRGGYASCTNAQNDLYIQGDPNTYVDGGGNGPTFKLFNDARVDLYNFEITGGNGSLGGGIESINSIIRVLRSEVHSNSGGYGGGIYVHHDNIPSAGSTFEVRDSVVAGNNAVFAGGGVYCSNGRGLIDENSGISANQASGVNGDGGGMFLSFCDIDFYGGTTKAAFPSDWSSYNGIKQNSANRNGGGIFAVSSLVNLFGAEHDFGQLGIYGTNSTPMNIQDNVADADNDLNGSGGGIYLLGQMLSPASVIIENGLIENNRAYNGGVIYQGFNSIAKIWNFVNVTDNNPCWSEECSVIKNNTATNSGGVIHAEGGSSLSIRQSHLSDNRADYGSVISLDGTLGEINASLSQNLIVHNGRDGVGEYSDLSSFNLYNNSAVIEQIQTNITMSHNTIADNHNTQGVIVTNGVHINLGVFSSILSDHDTPKIGDFFSIASDYDFDCVNTNNSSSLDSAYTTRTRMDSSFPGFVSRNYDYRIKQAAATEDFCDDSLLPMGEPTRDLENKYRPHDNLNYIDLYGSWDLGAYEVIEASDVIFIDKFDW